MPRLVARVRLMKLEVALLSSELAREHAHAIGMRHTLARLARLLLPSSPPGGGDQRGAAAAAARDACDRQSAALARDLAALLARDTEGRRAAAAVSRRPGRTMAGA